ncbi:MAG: nuclear transport factor 2 family protein [Sphingobacteriales bacterium]|nr:nuclear transport factor 2 family protein [Sphingobacteriales bacterium]MBI3717316.1 nuclear transport factor 2 family protein [Sphingobacteriales bacterium]
MRKLLLPLMGIVLLVACNNEKPAEKKDAAVAPATESKEAAPAEFADKKFGEMAGKQLDALTAGDVDGWMSAYADNAVYVWNYGDSLAGKKAITDYWKNRRANVIDSITFSNRVFLPVKVNKPQSVEQPGNWVLCWYLTNAKYKNGKRMVQWIHTDIHYDANDKIDRLIQYVDRSLINAALAK